MINTWANAWRTFDESGVVVVVWTKYSCSINREQTRRNGMHACQGD